MTHQAIAQRKIAIPSKALWKTISGMTGMEDWYPALISKSEIFESGEHIGRNCKMTNGGELKERILTRDDQTKTFVYAIDSHPLPARNVVGTIRIDDLGDTSVVTWSAQFDVDANVTAQTIAMISQMYEDGLQSLEAFHRA